MFSHPDLFLSRLLFVGVFVEAWETIATRHTFDDDGLFSRSTLRILTSGLDRVVRVGATSGQSTAVTAAMAVQATAALTALVAGLRTPAGILGALGCLATSAYLRARRQIGGSGAEQLTFLALVTFGLVVTAGGGDQARRVGDFFIAAQVALAYFAAGVAKAVSPVWRRGRAMSTILSAEGYGIAAVAGLLERRPLLDAALCWGVMAWEVTFPVVLISPMPIAVSFLAVGCLFHIGCAVLMGLNRFVWAFVGCYPAVIVAVEYYASR